MFFPILTLISVIAALPCEYVIDYGPAAVPVTYNVRTEFVAGDDTALEFTSVWGKNLSPEFIRDGMIIFLKKDGWVARPGPGNSLIVTGTAKGSAVKSVTVKSEAPVPTVRWVPIPPPPA